MGGLGREEEAECEVESEMGGSSGELTATESDRDGDGEGLRIERKSARATEHSRIQEDRGLRSSG